MLYRREFKPPAKGDDSTVEGLRRRVDDLERALSAWFLSHQSPGVVVISDEQIWTPTVSSAGGTLTTTAVDAYYWKIGEVYFYFVEITLTNAGTGTGALNFTLPVTARLENQGYGREVQTTGYALTVTCSANSATAGIVNYDGTSPITTGHICRVQGFFVA